MNQQLRRDFQSILDTQLKDLDLFVNANVVLTGASGFVGKWIVGSWLHACENLGGTGNVLLTCRKPESLLAEFPNLRGNKRVTIIASDIRSLTIPVSFRPSIVIHGATSASESLNLADPLEMIDVIVNGTRHMIEIARGISGVKFVFLSSGAVYGNMHHERETFRETDLTAPDISDAKNAYHEAKRLAEMLLGIESAKNGLDYVSLRLFTFLAPFIPFDLHFAAGNFLSQALRGEDIMVQSNGKSIRSYQYGSDLVRFVLAATVRKMSNMAYNVGSAEPVTIRELAFTVRDVVAPSCMVKIMKPNDISFSNYVPSIDRIASELKMKNLVTLRESIERTMSWSRAKS